MILKKQPMCILCKHYKYANICQAYLDKIPDKIINSEIKHFEKLKNQNNDIVFELDENKVKKFDLTKDDVNLIIST